MLILEGHSGAVLSVAYAPDSRTLASGGSDQSVRLWDLCSGSAHMVIPNAGDVVLSLAFSPDGNTLAVGTHSCITHWNLTTGQPGRPYGFYFAGTYVVIFAPNGEAVIVASYLGSQPVVWPVASLSPTALQGRGTGILALAHAPHHPLLVSGGGAPNGGELVVWDMTQLAPPVWLRDIQAAHAGAVYSVAISPDARLIASGGKDQVAKIWERETGRVRFRLSGHRGTVVAVSFPPDGRTLLTADEGGTIRLWNVDTGKQQASWDWKIGQLRSVVFAPDGMTAAAGGNDRVLVWDID